MACQSRHPFLIDARSPWSLRRGVAYRLASLDLEALRKELALAFQPRLKRQDQVPYRPHIIVQNKVEPDEARELLEHLQMEFEPFEILAEGLLLWHYLGGPWALVDRFEFDASLSTEKVRRAVSPCPFHRASASEVQNRPPERARRST